MLNVNNLNMYFNGTSYQADNDVAHFTASFNGTNYINFTFDSQDIEALRNNAGGCLNDFGIFVKQILEITDHDMDIKPVEMPMV